MTTTENGSTSAVSRSVTVLLTAALVAAAYVYRDPLQAWFGGVGGAVDAGKQAAAKPEHAAHGEIDHYTCSMHPSVNQPGPGKCPICGMTLVPVKREQHGNGPVGVVTIDESRRQLIGVRTAQVTQGPMTRVFRAVGSGT